MYVKWLFQKFCELINYSLWDSDTFFSSDQPHKFQWTFCRTSELLSNMILNGCTFHEIVNLQNSSISYQIFKKVDIFFTLSVLDIVQLNRSFLQPCSFHRQLDCILLWFLQQFLFELLWCNILEQYESKVKIIFLWRIICTVWKFQDFSVIQI